MAYRNELALLFNQDFNGLLDIPVWLTRELTRLLPKKDDTENPIKLPISRMSKKY